MCTNQCGLNNRTVFGLAIFSFLGIGLLIGVLALLLHQTPLAIIQEIIKSYVLNQIFFCHVGHVGPLHFHLLFYLFFTILSLVLYLLLSLRPQLFGIQRKDSNLKLIPYLALMLAAVIITLQAANHIQIFGRESKVFAGRTLDQKLAFLHQTPYLYAKSVHSLIPHGRYRGVYISDGDIQTEPFMGEHRRLAYFLYPMVDIRNVRPDASVDCLIYYRKNNAREFVPKNFVIVGKFHSSFLIAVDQRLLSNDRH